MPTGYGKSLIFQLLLDIYNQLLHVKNSESVMLVISPLNALMHNEIAKLNERSISACMIQRHGHHGVMVSTAKKITLSSYYWRRLQTLNSS